ncbi:hypothetical protein H311_02492, partial [Anncaliia algerae PRA109]
MIQEFCKECNNILYPKEDKEEKTLLLTCKSCEYIEESQNNIIFSADYSFRSKISHNINPKDLVNDPSLLRTVSLCNICGCKEAVVYFGDEFDDDFVFVVYLICVKCFSMTFV